MAASMPMSSCLLSLLVEEVKLLLYEHWELQLKYCITTPLIKISVSSNINIMFPLTSTEKMLTHFQPTKHPKSCLFMLKMRCPLQVQEPARIPGMIKSNPRDSTQCANSSSFQDTVLVQHLSLRNWINKPYISLLQQQISVPRALYTKQFLNKCSMGLLKFADDTPLVYGPLYEQFVLVQEK